MRRIVSLLVALACATSVQADFPIIQTVDSEGNVGSSSSLALDSSGHPRIAYWDQTNLDLRYAAWNGLSWDIQPLDSTGDTGRVPSLALDSGDYAHITYWDNNCDRTRYAYENSSGWHLQTVTPPGENAPGPSSLALDSAGHPHMSYLAWLPTSRQTLRYGSSDGSSWTFETVDNTGTYAGNFNSLALDSNGWPHISYLYEAGGSRHLRYAAWDGVALAWDITTVHTGGHVGLGTSLALDSSDYPHISYADVANENLMYAWWDPALNGGAGDWDMTPVDSTGDAQWYNAATSLALDSSGSAHISYYNQTNQELRYAVGSGWSWDIQTVDSSGPYVYQNLSLALDSSGFAHISYYDGTNDDLKYANNTPEVGTWLLLACTGAVGAAVRRRREKK